VHQDSVSFYKNNNYHLAIWVKYGKVIDTFIISADDPLFDRMKNEFIILSWQEISNFLGIGTEFDINSKKSIPHKPYPSWNYDESIQEWIAPICYNGDENVSWNENLFKWEVVREIPKIFIPLIEEL
jgi:hypothetical protein